MLVFDRTTLTIQEKGQYSVWGNSLHGLKFAIWGQILHLKIDGHD